MKMKIGLITSAILIGVMNDVLSQTPPGIHEIQTAKALIARDFMALSQAIAVIGCIFGMLGGLRVYTNWQEGKRNIDAEVMGWFGSCIFFNLIALFISTFYGISTT